MSNILPLTTDSRSNILPLTTDYNRQIDQTEYDNNQTGQRFSH